MKILMIFIAGIMMDFKACQASDPVDDNPFADPIERSQADSGKKRKKTKKIDDESQNSSVDSVDQEKPHPDPIVKKIKSAKAALDKACKRVTELTDDDQIKQMEKICPPKD